MINKVDLRVMPGCFGNDQLHYLPFALFKEQSYA